MHTIVEAPARVCKECGGPISTKKRSDALFCTDACHVKHNNHKKYKPEWRDRTLKAKRSYRASTIGRSLVLGAKQRAVKRGISFDLLGAVAVPAVCPVLGISLLVRGKTTRDGSSPSLDRIDSKQGYTAENVRVISDKANRLKSDGTSQELGLVYHDSCRLSTNLEPEYMI